MKHIHLIGIGGTGLSAIARMLLESGYKVSGSDQSMSILARNLQDLGIKVFVGHQSENIAGAELVVRSSAIPDSNPEVIAAQKLGIPVLKRADFLGQFMVDKTGIAVGGTHGKTTTTAMIATILSGLGQDPSYIVGGIVKDLKSNAHSGKGSAFVIEADEYDRMFLGLRPKMIVLTAVDYDHPDCYPTLENYRQAFMDFIATLPEGGKLIIYRDQPVFEALAQKAAEEKVKVITYGTSDGCDFQALNLKSRERSGFSFDCTYPSGSNQTIHLALQIPGRHNVLNATAAMAVIDQLSLPMEKAAAILGTFHGAERRFDVLGETAGITLINDYAHHPTEIRTTLAAARARYPQQRIWAVWQPHTFTRTRSLLSDFANAFGDADRVIITEIFASREAHQNFSSSAVVNAMHDSRVDFIPALPDVTTYLAKELKAGDIVLVLSAGDADNILHDLYGKLNERSTK